MKAPAGLALLSLILLACATGRTRVEVELGMDPARYRRVAVLPFTDRRGQGWLISAKVNKGLFERDYNTVDLHQIESVFKSLKLDYSSGLGIHSLAEIRHATLAEALVFGALDSEWREASVIMIEAEMGDVVFTAKVRPRRGRAFTSIDQVAEETLRLFPWVAQSGPPKTGAAAALAEPE